MHSTIFDLVIFRDVLLPSIDTGKDNRKNSNFCLISSFISLSLHAYAIVMCYSHSYGNLFLKQSHSPYFCFKGIFKYTPQSSILKTFIASWTRSAPPENSIDVRKNRDFLKYSYV